MYYNWIGKELCVICGKEARILTELGGTCHRHLEKIINFYNANKKVKREILAHHT